ncbi:phage tail tube protein [Micromonospora sp. NPDC048930]|uniref:phage tail tube protein n=1 Tax=Micromonospora sp. NPDC048930 TaxID=3364261 RepID=UPI00371119E7
MATTPTTRVTALARRYRVDIDTGVYPASQYQELMGKAEVKLIEELRTEGDEAYEDNGAAREQVTGYNWRLEIKLFHSKNAAGTALDTVHRFLRTKFEAAKLNGAQAGEFGVRWYDKDGLDDGNSKEGRAYVKAFPPDGGNPGALDMISLVIQGQGPLAAITNPNATTVPAVTGLSPAGGSTAGGNLVQVYGSKFTGASAVKFGATNATNYTVVNDTLIVATAPAATAGAKDVTVTTPGGTSPNTAADDYTYA